MKIAHVSATFPPYRGGTGNVCFHNARQLARLGHEVHVFTATPSAKEAKKVSHQNGFAVHRLQPLVQVGNAPVLPQLMWQLQGFDLIHLHCPFIAGAELTSLAATLSGTPLVVTYHNDLIRSGTWRDTIFRLATRSSRYMVLNRATRVLFVSQGHAETCDQRTVYLNDKERSQILPNGVDRELFCPATDRAQVRQMLNLGPNQNVIGFVGGLDQAHHYKGLDVLLQALTTDELAGAHLLVVGDGDLKELYRQQSHELGVNERVLFHGAVAQEELPPLYRACDVVSMPSLVAESFGLVVIEALGCGIPVVASNGPGVRTIIRHNSLGLLVEPGDSALLADALHRLLQDKAQRQIMGRQGSTEVKERYTWHQIGLRLESIYQQILGRGVALQEAYG